MATEIQWDEPQQWHAISTERIGTKPRWEVHVTQRAVDLVGTDWEWAVEYRTGGEGTVNVRGCSTDSARAREAASESLARLEVAYRVPASSTWPEILRALLESSGAIVAHEGSPATSRAAFYDEHRAVCDRARRVLATVK